MSDRTQISVDVDPNLRKEFRREIAERDVTAKLALTEAIRDWIDKPKRAITGDNETEHEKLSPPFVGVPQEVPQKLDLTSAASTSSGIDDPWVKKLLRILHSGHAAAAQAIQANLAVFEEVVGGLESDRVPPSVPADREARMDRLRKLGARSGRGGSDTGKDAPGVSGKTPKHPGKTGTRGDD